MRVPIPWLRDYVDLPTSVSGRELSDALINLGLEVETVDVFAQVEGPVVIGRVVAIEELTEFKKPIRFCRVEVGPQHGGTREIVCGAANFAVGDLVVVALPGSVLPGGFAIASRQTYGHTSDGMICSSKELDLGDDHDGIMVLEESGLDVGEPAADHLGFNVEVLDIAVTPDRGYALSIRGVARETAIAFGLEFRDKAMELAALPAPTGTAEPVACAFDDSGGCDVFTARTLLDVDASVASPRWMTSRLLAAGMRPVSLVVDITNYVMLETGQPLHAFDKDTLSGGLVARRANPGEKLTTLDHVERTLDPADLVIADDSGPLALAGTMGGLSSEISADSTNIVLEAAHFNPVVVAQMSRRHKLSSEASRRFERGVDQVIPPYASEYAASLICELAGGLNAGMTAEQAPAIAQNIVMSGQLPAQVAGMEISTVTAVDSLVRVGCEVTSEGAELHVVPPTWRPDLTDSADAVEEVIRLLGYDRIPSRLPAAPAGRGLTVAQQLRRRASRIAAAMGLVEVLNYPFIGVVDFDKTGIAKDDPRRNAVRLANPLSEEQPSMRTLLLPGLLAAARRNWSRGAESVAIFEVGAVARVDATQSEPETIAIDVSARPSPQELAALNARLPVQHRAIAGVLAGAAELPSWWGPGRTIDWADAVRLATEVADQLGVEVSVEAGAQAPFHPGRCAQLVIDGEVLGYAGELHPRVCTAWELPERACAFELDLDAIIARGEGHVPHGPSVHTYPVAKEDVALVVDESTPVSDVRSALVSGAGELLEDVRLFDVFRGAQIGEGKKSLAFALRFRAPDRTLEVAEVTQARTRAISKAKDLCGAQLRS